MMEDSDYDPVLGWLQECAGGVPPLTHETAYDLGELSLRVRSNSLRLSEAVRQALHLYVAPLEEAGAANSRCIIEVFYVKCSNGPGISLPFGSKSAASASFTGPSPSEVVESDEMIHLRWGQVESFWRPFDLLVSMRVNEPNLTRILFAGGVERKETAIRSGDPREPGEPHWPDLADIVCVVAAGHKAGLCLHAATVADGDTAVVLAGPAGSGKTTTSLALLRGGFDLLSDEVSILETGSDGRMMASGLLLPPRVVGKQPAALSLLEQTLDFERRAGKENFILPLPLAQRGLRRKARVAALVFLSHDQTGGDHRFRRFPEDKAFVRLMTLLVLDPMGAFRMQKQADMAVRFVQSCPAYHLSLGRKLDALPDVVRSIIHDSIA